jgi:hypothetical protein
MCTVKVWRYDIRKEFHARNLQSWGKTAYCVVSLKCVKYPK